MRDARNTRNETKEDTMTNETRRFYFQEIVADAFRDGGLVRIGSVLAECR